MTADKDALLREDEIELAYWRFDARRKGYSDWKGAPQSERDAFKAELRARITAPLAEKDDGGWLPMVSAPLDGTEINLLIRHFEFWTVMKVSGRDVAERDYQEVCKGKWIDHNGGGWTWRGLAGTQVGWRPLPPLPQGDE